MTPDALAATMEATWPPASSWRLGPWRLRDGAGGGKRVSAATVEGDWQPADIDKAEQAMADPLFMLRVQDADLDAALDQRGYRVVDPVVAYTAAPAAFGPPPQMATFCHWPPLQIAADLWAEGGIGPARLAVMDRAKGPKTTILARTNNRPVGVAYVALHDGTAMLHALEVAPAHRRQGSAQNLLAAAADWARGQGAARLALVVTQANTPARTLYTAMGMQVAGHYHYRQR